VVPGTQEAKPELVRVFSDAGREIDGWFEYLNDDEVNQFLAFHSRGSASHRRGEPDAQNPGTRRALGGRVGTPRVQALS
jgi:hypothetical protein